MMRIPECFECLLANAMVGGGVNQHHTQKHDVASDTGRASEMQLDRQFISDVVFFDVVETATD